MSEINKAWLLEQIVTEVTVTCPRMTREVAALPTSRERNHVSSGVMYAQADLMKLHARVRNESEVDAFAVYLQEVHPIIQRLNDLDEEILRLDLPRRVRALGWVD